MTSEVRAARAVKQHDSLESVSARAFEVGRKLDLSACRFEPDFMTKWRHQYWRLCDAWNVGPIGKRVLKPLVPVLSPFLPNPQIRLEVVQYYYFLAGLVETLELRQIVEVGTYFGGSTLAMRIAQRGLPDPDDTRLVTVDIKHFRPSVLLPEHGVNRVFGDSVAADTLRKVQEGVRGSIDMLYLDATHFYDQVKAEFQRYCELFQPTWVVLDDIHLNESMERFWQEVVEDFGPLAFDATAAAHREPTAGFGIVHYGGR